MKLDRFISKHSRYSQRDVRLLVAQGKILVDGKLADSPAQIITKFSKVELESETLNSISSIYLVLHKPTGVVSATKDDIHTTVLDLIDHPSKSELHIAGRLDLNTSGVVILTNDGRWSRALSLPESKLKKEYDVQLAKPIEPEYFKVFEQGIYFAYEGITTQPAELIQHSPTSATLTITEGKYHQIKRMFGHFRNEVVRLHRSAVGPVNLEGLAVGEYRWLTEAEVNGLSRVKN